LSTTIKFRMGDHLDLSGQEEPSQGTVSLYRSPVRRQRRITDYNQQVYIAVLMRMTIGMGAIKVNYFRLQGSYDPSNYFI